MTPQMTPDPSIPECPLFLSSGQAQKSLPTSHPTHVLACQKITERFFRNPAKPADEDVAERVFLILDERIQLRYHCREDRITASKREFLWRTEGDSKGNKIIMTPDMCLSFEVRLEALAGRGRWGWGEERALGPSVLSQQLGRTGIESPGSQPGNSSLPLGKIKSSHLGYFSLSASENLPLFHQERQPSWPRLLIVPTPQSWVRADPGTKAE